MQDTMARLAPPQPHDTRSRTVGRAAMAAAQSLGPDNWFPGERSSCLAHYASPTDGLSRLEGGKTI